MFLHNQGYNYFNWPKLTIPEQNNLVSAWNEEQTEIKKESERNRRKMRNKR